MTNYFTLLFRPIGSKGAYTSMIGVTTRNFEDAHKACGQFEYVVARIFA